MLKKQTEDHYISNYKKTPTNRWGFFVRVKGLEPPSREALDPKSSVSTNFTTPAKGMQI